MTLEIRPFAPSDYDAYKSVHDAVDPGHPLNLEASRHEDWLFSRTRFKQRRYVVEVGGRVVAVGGFFHEVFAYKPNVFSFRAEVHPDSQNQGIGTLLCEKLFSELRAMEAEMVWTPALPGTPSSRFAEGRGFVEARRDLESVLDLRRFDVSRVGPVEARVRADGIDLRSLASETRSDPDAGRKLYELEIGAGDDVPRLVKSEHITYDEYSMVILQNPTYLLAGSFVAIADGMYVGSSNLWKAGPEGYLGQGFTAVKREHRRRGIATALKLMVARAARTMGGSFLRTSNDSENDPMLRLNRKIGFERTQAWAVYEKRLRG